jgi:hypothetical protein
MRCIFLAITVMLTGCALFESREQSTETEEERRIGHEGGHPVDLLIQRKLLKNGDKSISSPPVTAAAEAGGGLLGLLSGAGGVTGIAGIAIAMLKAKQAKAESDFSDAERADHDRTRDKLNRALAALPPEKAKDIL